MPTPRPRSGTPSRVGRAGHAGRAVLALAPFARAALALALLAPARAARAADAPSLALRWRAPAGCPSELEVRAAVERLVGRVIPAGGASGLQAEAEVDGVEGHWRVRLRTSAGAAEGEKQLEAASCRSLADAVALVVAFAYDPQARGAREAAPATTPLAPAAPERDRAADVRAVRAGAPLRPSAHVAFALGAGALPGATPGFSIGVGLARSVVRVEAVGSAWLTRSARLSARPDAPTPGGQFELWALGARACYVPERGPLGVDLCGLGEAGRMTGRGEGVTRVESASALWGAVGAGLTAHWAFATRLGLRASIEGLMPLARPTFVIEPLGEVYRPAPVHGRAALGAEANF